MIWRWPVLVCFAASLIAASPVLGCMPALLPPRQAGETDEAYRARIEQEQLSQEAEWLHERQVEGLRSADLIFVARKIDRPAPLRRQSQRGRLLPLPPVRFLPFPPIYFRTGSWFRGHASQAIFRVSTSNTTCGPMSLGDTMRGDTGALYVFFARAGPVDEARLIDAIAIDRINDPALLDFVARFRNESVAPRPGAS
jgi:hypothetical protein